MFSVAPCEIFKGVVMLEGLRTLGQAALDWRSKDAHTPEEALLQALVKVDEADRYSRNTHHAPRNTQHTARNTPSRQTRALRPQRREAAKH